MLVQSTVPHSLRGNASGCSLRQFTATSSHHSNLQGQQRDFAHAPSSLVDLTGPSLHCLAAGRNISNFERVAQTLWSRHALINYNPEGPQNFVCPNPSFSAGSCYKTHKAPCRILKGRGARVWLVVAAQYRIHSQYDCYQSKY